MRKRDKIGFGTGVFTHFSSSDTNAALPPDALTIGSAQEESFYANELSDGNGFNWLLVVNETGANVEIEVAKLEVEPLIRASVAYGLTLARTFRCCQILELNEQF